MSYQWRTFLEVVRPVGERQEGEVLPLLRQQVAVVTFVGHQRRVRELHLKVKGCVCVWGGGVINSVNDLIIEPPERDRRAAGEIQEDGKGAENPKCDTRQETGDPDRMTSPPQSLASWQHNLVSISFSSGSRRRRRRLLEGVMSKSWF